MVEYIIDALDQSGQIGRIIVAADGSQWEAAVLPPVSYTHLDVYKRQVLAARHLVYIYFRVWKQFGLVRGFIIWTYGFPITG